MKTNIGIAEDHLRAVALELNKVLADEFILYTKTRNYHWNVEGHNFMEMHQFYESQFDQLDEIMMTLLNACALWGIILKDA